MSLNQKFWGMILVMIAGIVVLFVTDGTLWTGIGIILICIGAVIDLVWMRCPHCKAWLGNNPSKVCKRCGKEIDFNAKS